jgi:hypothetical protein
MGTVVVPEADRVVLGTEADVVDPVVLATREAPRVNLADRMDLAGPEARVDVADAVGPEAAGSFLDGTTTIFPSSASLRLLSHG